MPQTQNPFDQHGFDVRFAWGLDGIRAVGSAVGVIVVVDVLSFSTCVEVAVGRGATVLPYSGPAGAAVAYAAHHDAVLAERRAGPGWSLSPQSLLSIPPGTRLVLPSPNGSVLAMEAAESGTVIAGCLRNASAVGATLREVTPPIAVIAAGERWGVSQGPLRPAVEDHIGAGAIIGALGSLSCSPEARVAWAAFEAARASLGEWIRSAASGRELIEEGFAPDVEIATDLDAGDAVPVLHDGAFVRRSVV